MAYFAIRCVAGRELLTKKYIEAAVQKQKRTDVISVVVPSQTVLDLNDSHNNGSNSEIMIRYRSYIFVNIETLNKNSFIEMPGELFSFLSNIPNVVQVMKVNVEPSEAAWITEHDSTLVAFGVPTQSPVHITNSRSMLTKVKELIEQKKVLSRFKRFVHSISHPHKIKGLSFSVSVEKVTIIAPIELMMAALNQTKLIMSDLLNSPYKLVDAINNVYWSYAKKHKC